MNKLGRPKTKKRELKKLRSVRVSDKMIAILKAKNLTLQSFIDFNLKRFTGNEED